MTGPANGGDARCVFIAEPQCWALEHVSFNAALVASLLHAYPSARIIFVGESTHVGHLRAALEEYGAPRLDAVEWRTERIPPRHLTGWPRMALELRQLNRLLAAARDAKADLVVFASITNTGILALKLLCRKWPRAVPVFGVIHGMINRIVGPWPKKPWNRPLNLRVVLRLPQPPALWYILLGESLLEELTVAQPKLVDHFATFDLPTVTLLKDEPRLARRPSPLRFGHLGVGNLTKGFGVFARIAAEAHGLADDADFMLVGYLSTFRDDTDFSHVTGVSEDPVPLDAYDRKAASLTYVINASVPEDYRFAASSSFLEALFYGKPGIYLRNPYIAWCFESMGDIGYLCDTPEEMIATVRSLILDFPLERYQRQVANIVAGRQRFAPPRVAEGIRRTVAACRAS